MQKASSPGTTSLLRKIIANCILPLRFFLILLIPLSMLDAVRFGRASDMPNLFALWPIFVNFGLLTIIDYLVGKDNSQPYANARKVPLYRGIALAALPAHMLALWWGLHVYTTANFDWTGKVAWILSVGAISGTLAITAAHELIHKQSKLEQWVGGILLSSVCYGGFKIEHIFGHHVHVSTPQDASSAKYGQSVYDFLPKAIYFNTRNAWRLEAARLKRHKQSQWHNEMLRWTAFSIAFALSAYLLFGIAGLVFFIGQSVVAFCELEVINYVEHYGLERQKTATGYERVRPEHSWNSSNRLMNYFLLNLARHSDHHANASRRYQELRHFEEAPQLPGGYAAMVLLALVPPLWFRVIHPRMPMRGVEQS
jgi:alkane 1-monooxygenase